MSDNGFDGSRAETTTRLEALSDKGFVIIVTRAFGPNGEDLVDPDGPMFSGEPGIKLRVKQGDLEGDVVLSPYYGDPSKVTDVEFAEGERCTLYCPTSGAELDRIPGMTSEDGGGYYAVYLTEKLGEGELVAVNDVWGNYDSQMLDEGEVLAALAEAEDAKASS
jgi:hypothetical protein